MQLRVETIRLPKSVNLLTATSTQVTVPVGISVSSQQLYDFWGALIMLRRILTFMAVLAVSASLTAVSALPTSAASAAARQAPSCPEALIIGLHGAGEGPSPTDSQKSATIQATFNAFKAEVKKLPNDGTSHSYRLQWFGYPTVPYSDLTSLSGLGKTVGTVGTVATQLYNYISGQAATCPATHISVVGFSLGAWVINVALTQHYYMAGLLNLVLLEGDPCWSHTGDGSAGLAQRVQEARLLQLGCLAADTYPYLTFANPFTAQSLCVNKDPICGEGYSAFTLYQQLTAAKNCSPSNGCPHFDYPSDGAAAEGGRWLADYAFT